MFGNKTDLNKLARLRYSIALELKLLNNKIELLYSSKNVSKSVLSDIKDINDNLQNNLQYLRLMLEYDDNQIEILDDDLTDKYSDKTEILDFDDYKTEILDDLTREIEILNDNNYRTELLDDLTREIEILDVDDSDEIEQLEILENTISLNLESIKDILKSNEKSTKHNEQLNEINEDLTEELVDIDKKLYKRIRKLKIKRYIWTGIFIIFFMLFVIISCIIVDRVFDNYKVNNEIKDLQQFVEVSTYDTIESNDELMSILSSVYANNEDNEDNVNEEQNTDMYHKYISMNALNIDFNELKNINGDTKGWIKVDGTKINYPFVQTTDNKFYLKHSFDKTRTYMGWIFMDYRNSTDYNDRNTILYGHGLLNETMFGSLRKTLDSDWFENKNNHIIKIYNEYGFRLYQVFSNYTIEPESYYITTNFSDDESYKLFIDTLIRRSVYNYNVDVTVNDKILTLSTCYSDRERAVVHAKFIYSSY